VNRETPYEKMSEAALDDARFDQPRTTAHRRDRAYVICTTPRSARGSCAGSSSTQASAFRPSTSASIT
jgi:hypothetical protein